MGCNSLDPYTGSLLACVHLQFTMNFSNIKHNLLTLAGETSIAHPVTWIYTSFFLGTAFGITLWSFIGWSLGSLVGNPITGMYLCLGIYAYIFTFNLEPMKAKCDQMIQTLRDYKNV